MTRRAHFDPSVAMSPIWRRWAVACCALLLAVFSTAQAAHVHRVGSPDPQVRLHAVGTTPAAADEALCPLCTAAHHALPTVSPVSLGQPTALVVVFVAARDHGSLRPRHFAQFSRPPPSFSQA